jgi:nitroimidazol reductase NimA-like FMN-containing flavoprotein (pyridoxamine 5'-phosphate oxidase superfamily)
MRNKWVNEIILEKLPPFSWVPQGYNVALQLFTMETVGIVVAVLFSMPSRSILYGSLAILVVTLWSFLAFHIPYTVRRLRLPSAPLEREVIRKYKNLLFSPLRYELVIAAVILLSIASYLILFGHNLVVLWLGKNLNLILLALVAILLWDASYRLGLGLWSAIVAFRRSMDLFHASKMRTKMRYTAYKELKTLKRLDLINLSFGLSSLLLYPLCSPDTTFFMGLLMYAAVVFFLSMASLTVIRRIPGFPQEVIWLLNEGRFGYIGTSDGGMKPHLTPVIFVFDGPNIFFVVSKISKKLSNIRENNKIAFLVDVRDPNNLYNNRAVMFLGRAKVYSVMNAALGIYRLLRVRRNFYKKYPKYVHKYKTEEEKLPLAWRTTLFLSRMLVRLDVEKMVYWREARPIRLPLR